MSGTIEIDGVDVCKIGLIDLRSRLAIIPQDPALISGTLRENLDPFGQYSDESLWQALASSQLDRFVQSLPDRLLHVVAQQGSNMSVGQRQLLCLARALLHHANVLLLDEATAAVDVETDERIQLMIREQFANCTVITIAHRLNTVADCDRVLVLGEGRVVDFDTPEALHAKGLFPALGS